MLEIGILAAWTPELYTPTFTTYKLTDPTIVKEHRHPPKDFRACASIKMNLLY